MNRSAGKTLTIVLIEEWLQSCKKEMKNIKNAAMSKTLKKYRIQKIQKITKPKNNIKTTYYLLQPLLTTTNIDIKMPRKINKYQKILNKRN